MQYKNKDNNNNNNNNKGSSSIGEVVPLYKVDPALVLTKPVCNGATSVGSHSLPCTQDRPCVMKNYNRQWVGLLKRNTANLEE